MPIVVVEWNDSRSECKKLVTKVRFQLTKQFYITTCAVHGSAPDARRLIMLQIVSFNNIHGDYLHNIRYNTLSNIRESEIDDEQIIQLKVSAVKI